MAKYGDLGIAAARKSGLSGQDPREAWDALADEAFGKGRAKCCPRSAFLGLCGAGLVKGIPPGKYARSTLNGDRAIKAVEILARNPELTYSQAELWRLVAGRKGIGHDQQMTVVLALWGEGLIAVPGCVVDSTATN